jgi:methyl-accepting chemotaxis protein
VKAAQAEQSRFGLAAVCAATTLASLLAFAPVLRALEPAGLSTAFSLLRLAAQGVLCFALGTAIAWALAQRAADALALDAEGAADSASRIATRFAAGTFAAWMLSAAAGLLLEPGAPRALDRMLGYAAIGLAAATANVVLAGRVVAPFVDALRARVPSARRSAVARPLSLAWTLRLLVVALVGVPAALDMLLERANPELGLGSAVVGVAGIALALGLVVVETVGAAVRGSTASLRAAAHGSLAGAPEAAGWAEFAAVFDAIAALSGRVHDALAAFEAAAAELGEGSSQLDATRESVALLTDAQVADVQQLTLSMSSVYSHSEKISESIQNLRIAVDESSSAITELGAAGEQLVATAREMLSRADTVSSSIQRALSSLGDVATSTDVLAGVATDASTSMEQMATSMREVNESAERCSSLSDQVVGVADQGSQIVQQTIDGMQAIREATATAESVIRDLGARAGEIGAIVDVIDGVANETSLLALNAAIIAAQAGEHGRGFSVVAGEIRQLATRVSSSTAEITALIRSVQGESANAIGAIERGAHSVAKGVELSEEAGRSLVEITRVARTNKKLVQGIVSSVSEQTKAATHVVGVIEEVSAQAERIRAAAREQQQGNDVVLEQASAMKEMARQVHHTADEQSRGMRLIVETVENVVSGTDQMGTSVSEQTAGCSRVVAATWEAFKRAKETHDATSRLASVADRLRAGAAEVSELVEKIRS